MNRATGCSRACTKRYSPQTQSGTPSVATTGERSGTARDGSSASGSPVYPHVGVDASGLATLRALVATHLRCVPAYAAPAHAAPAPAGTLYAMAAPAPGVALRTDTAPGSRERGSGHSARRAG